MKIPIYQVDAFAGEVFRGNPAAVCPLDRWLDDRLLQQIAAENNLSETAYFVRNGDHFELRWFTPGAEVDLCGHATLASAYVLFEQLGEAGDSITFQARTGRLRVLRRGDLLVLDFPTLKAESCTPPPELLQGLGEMPGEVLLSHEGPKGGNYMAVFAAEAQVRALQPRMDHLSRLGYYGVIATAPGEECDFVSRYFFPGVGVPEDPVTGSAHCTLTPYWAERLGRNRLQARQVSLRGGELECELLGERVQIAGRAVLYLEGTLHLP